MANNNFARDYVDVPTRIQEFYEKYPEGALSDDRWELVTAGDCLFVVCEAKAYRTPDDPRPGVGLAWEPIPGPTSFTRDSELMNAQTSAWGRAIAALGFATKHIATEEDVRNRYQGPPAPQQQRRQAPPKHAPTPPPEPPREPVQEPHADGAPIDFSGTGWWVELNRTMRTAKVVGGDIADVIGKPFNAANVQAYLEETQIGLSDLVRMASEIKV